MLTTPTLPPPVSNHLAEEVETQIHKETGGKEDGDYRRWHDFEERIDPDISNSHNSHNPTITETCTCIYITDT